jgi:hypothetical protein
VRIINYAIIGSGISSFISSLKIKNSFVLSKFSLNRKFINRSFNFYEFNNVGGNTNVWGAYINLKLWKHYLNKNKKFLIFYQKNKYFTTSKISNLKLFKNIGYLKCKKTGSILRLNKDKYPTVFKDYSMNGDLNNNGEILKKEFYDIIQLAGFNYKYEPTYKTDDFLKEDLSGLSDIEVELLKQFNLNISETTNQRLKLLLKILYLLL